jgi:hypothetical protein
VGVLTAAQVAALPPPSLPSPTSLYSGARERGPGGGRDHATLRAGQNNRVAARKSGNNSPRSDGGQATASAQWNTT